VKRVLGIYAEVFDEETGQVSVASLAEGLPWPPPLEEVRGGAPSEWIREAGGRPRGDEVEPESSTETPPSETSPSATQEPSAAVDEAPESGDEPQVAPMYMDALTQPEGEPAVSDEALPEIDVVDDPAALTLLWDEGVTEKNRRMHMAPFADGMWAVFENGGEFFVFLKRGRLKATEFESQSSLKEAKALASMLSKRWMAETQGDRFLQSLAAINAGDFVQWVGDELVVDEVHYHFRAGQVRRQQTTTILVYRAHKDDGQRSRIEIRLTPTKTGSTLAVWALLYGPDGKIIGSFFEADLPRARLADVRDLEFGPAPGKRLRWEKVSEWEETAEWGRHVVVLQRGRGLSGLVLRKRGGDVFLTCGEHEAVRDQALNVLLRHLRTRSRKVPSGGAAPESTAGSSPREVEPGPAQEAAEEASAVDAEGRRAVTDEEIVETVSASPDPLTVKQIARRVGLSEDDVAARLERLKAQQMVAVRGDRWARAPWVSPPEPEPAPESAPKSEPEESAPKEEAAPREKAKAAPPEPTVDLEELNLSKAMSNTLKAVAAVTPGTDEHSEVLEVSNAKSLAALEARGLLTDEGEVTELGDRVLRQLRQPKKAEADLETTADEGLAIDEAIGGAVNELASRMPPLPPE
jgi:hypothetical protein